MSDKFKKFFFAAMVLLPFLVYSIYYYTPIIRNAPFRSTDFKSFNIKWGTPQHLVNSYNSVTGEYYFTNKKDFLVNVNVKLRSDDMLYLHRKMSDIGLWNFPDVIKNDDVDTANIKNRVFIFEFIYKDKTKKVYFDGDYNDNPRLEKAAQAAVKIIQQTINDASYRYNAQ